MPSTSPLSTSNNTDFSLVEIILWEPCCGFWLLPEHLARLKLSAQYFAWQYDETKLVGELDNIVQALPAVTHKVYVQFHNNGEFSAVAEPVNEDRRPVRAAMAKQWIDTNNIFLYHKTTHRQIYVEAIDGLSEYDEVLLWNPEGEVTESCTSNLVIEIDQLFYTPPIECGLLPGTYRANLLKEGTLAERRIHKDELQICSKIYLINSLIGWREVILD